MSYWDIRKRAKLLHLPEPAPPLERAGVIEGDTRILRSHEWMKMYHAEKAMKESIREAAEEGLRGISQHADAASEDSDARDGEGFAGEGREDA